MTYHDPNLQDSIAADITTAVVPSTLTMDKFGQFEILRPTYMDDNHAVFYEKADIAILCERIKFDVPLDQLQRMEVTQSGSVISLHVEFVNDAAKEKFFADHGAIHLREAARNLVQQAGQNFIPPVEEAPIPTEPFIDSRGKLRLPEDVRRARYEHAASQNESTRDHYASRLGPPSWNGDTWDGIHNNADGPLTVRQVQWNLLGERPTATVQKIQLRADRSKDLPKREGPLLREKTLRDPNDASTHLERAIKRAVHNEEKGRGK